MRVVRCVGKNLLGIPQLGGGFRSSSKSLLEIEVGNAEVGNIGTFSVDPRAVHMAK